MACGLPVISSIGEFNGDIQDESCSIRIDPMNIDEIANAIKYLASIETERKRLSERAIKKQILLDLI